jgi:hypothetical protein
MTDLPLIIKSAKMKMMLNIKGRLLFERGKNTKGETAASLQEMREREIQHVLVDERSLPRNVLRFLPNMRNKN